ncbi:MAG TPA: hypothetical protein VLE49_02090, partial [Anaerolineales bacterium]|nr:hypothetical protein [Anaerolineales bacterium]
MEKAIAMSNEKRPRQQLKQEIDVLRENEEKLQAIMHSLPVGVSILGSDRKPIYTNPTLER